MIHSSINYNRYSEENKKIKILFLETPNPQNVRQHAQVPLGLLYIATIAKQAGHEVAFKRPKNTSEIRQYSNYNIICLSATTLEYPMTCIVAQSIRSFFPETKIFIGGVHATVMHEEVTKQPFFDKICIGEGELVILNMINDVQNKSTKKIYKADKFIENLDTIIFPNRSLIEGAHGGSIFLDKETGNENIITSRGCPFACAFCASKSIWKQKVRYRSIFNIVSEINYIISKYGTKVFRIADDNITSNPKRCLEFCEAITHLNIEWRCSIRAESITEEVAQALYKAGCREISPGIESGDQRVLDYLNKRTTLKKMFIGCRNASNAGLKIRALMMIGTPGEWFDTPERNKKYLEKLPYDGVTLSTFVPLPGTEIWNNPLRFNCRIMIQDFSLYNKDYYTMQCGKARKREYFPLIRNLFLTLDQQIDNVKRMETYIEELGKYNRG